MVKGRVGENAPARDQGRGGLSREEEPEATRSRWSGRNCGVGWERLADPYVARIVGCEKMMPEDATREVRARGWLPVNGTRSGRRGHWEGLECVKVA